MAVSSNDYMDQMVDYSNRFTKLGLQAWRMYEKVLGTDVTVTRVRSDAGGSVALQDAQRYAKILKGANNIDESNAKNHTSTFHARILINRSQMSAIYGKTTEEFQVTYTNNVFNVSDLIGFQYLKHSYRFKVTNIESFGLQDGLIFRMTLIPYREM